MLTERSMLQDEVSDRASTAVSFGECRQKMGHHVLKLKSLSEPKGLAPSRCVTAVYRGRTRVVNAMLVATPLRIFQQHFCGESHLTGIVKGATQLLSKYAAHLQTNPETGQRKYI